MTDEWKYPKDEHGEKGPVAIARVARLCSFEYWRTFDLWYAKARRVEEHERAAVAAAFMNPVFLPPAVYEKAERLGFDMGWYRKQEPIPTTGNTEYGASRK